MTPTGRLSEIICDLFDVEDIEGLIAENFEFAREIDFNRSRSAVARRVAGYVWDAGLEEPFLDAVAERRPNRQEEITSVRRLLAERRDADRSSAEWEVQGLIGADRSGLDYEPAELRFVGSSSPWSVQLAVADVDAEPATIELDAPPPATRALSGRTRDAGTDGAAEDPERILSDLDEVGRSLWRAVFSADGANLAAALPRINPQTGGRRITFNLTAAPGLAQHSWECLQRPGRPPMGIDVKSTIIRLIDHDEYDPADLKVPQPPLRLLIVAADSEQRDDFDFATEVARLGDTANIDIPDPLVDATFETLFKALRDQRPHILHFIGHGSARGIELAGSGSRTELLDASALATLVGNNLQTLRLVFLNSCRGAEETNQSSFTSAASQMIELGLPAAVAMQYPISNEAAIELSEIFYSYVAMGDEIDAAITQARSYLHGRGHPEWVAPALYTRRWQGGLALVGRAPNWWPPNGPIWSLSSTNLQRWGRPKPHRWRRSSRRRNRPWSCRAAARAEPVTPIDTPATARVKPSAPVDTPAAADGGPRTPVAAWLSAAALALALIAVAFLDPFGWRDSSTSPSTTQPPTSETTEATPTTTTEPTQTTTTEATPTSTTEPTQTTPTSTTEPTQTTPTEPDPAESDSLPLNEAASVAVAFVPSDQTGDFYVAGELVAPGTGNDEATEALDLPPGEYSAEVFDDAAGEAPERSEDRTDQPVATAEVVVSAQVSTVVVHVSDDGDWVIDTFEPDTGAVEAGRGRIEVRNLRDGEPVEVTVDGDALDQSIERGGSAAITPSSGEVTIAVASVDGLATATTTVALGDGDLFVVSVVGSSTEPAGLDLVTQHYSGLTTIPVGVDAGNSGLRALANAGQHPALSQLADPSPPAVIDERPRPSARTAGAVAPTAVRLNGVQLSAPIVPVGIDDDDTITVPAPDLAGWYRHGSLPGTEGSSTLVAHVDYDGRPAAFFDLHDVRVGDEVEVQMSDGSVERFVVTRSTYYDKDDLPVGELFDNTGPARLQLITCGGDFDEELRRYHGNVVVTAIPLAAVPPTWAQRAGVE